MRTVKMICTESIATSAAQTKKKGLVEQTMPSWDTDMQQLGFTQKPQRNYLIHTQQRHSDHSAKI